MALALLVTGCGGKVIRPQGAAQAITLGSKVRALLDGRFHVSFKDIKEVAVPAMRHRVILNFEGEAEGITSDMVLEKVVAETPTGVTIKPPSRPAAASIAAPRPSRA